MKRGPAVWATVIAVGLVNVGLATIIVGSMGQTTFAPIWVGEVILVLGVIAGVAAVVLWRSYISELRAR